MTVIDKLIIMPGHYYIKLKDIQQLSDLLKKQTMGVVVRWKKISSHYFAINEASQDMKNINSGLRKCLN